MKIVFTSMSNFFEQNQLVTYIPRYRDLYGDDIEEQVFISRIVQDNLKRIPELQEYVSYI